MSKFKVGDRVRLTGEAWSQEEHGVTAGDVVTVVSEDSEGGVLYAGGDEWYIMPDSGYGAELVKAGRIEASVDPEHYKFPGGAEVRHISEWLTANSAQALQYIARSSRIDGNNKGDATEDLKKAIKFLEFELERLEVSA